MNAGKWLTGALRIGYPTGSNCDYISIEVIDELSHSQVFEIHVGYEQFARCLSSRQVNCTFELQGIRSAGYERQSKTEYIPRKDGDKCYDKGFARTLARRCKPLEVDGWEADVKGAMSTQQNNRDFFAVHFFRYVLPGTTTPVDPFAESAARVPEEQPPQS